MAHKKKCPECNGCMSVMYISSHRFYYCEFCRSYYGGQDVNLFLVPRDVINALLQGDTNAYFIFQNSEEGV